MLSSVLSCNPAKLFMWRNYNYRRSSRSRYDGDFRSKVRWLKGRRSAPHLVFPPILPSFRRLLIIAASFMSIGETSHTYICTHLNAQVREAIRATTAAPTYFYPLVKEGLVHSDGALLANNPTAIAIHEAKVRGDMGVMMHALLREGPTRPCETE